MFGQYCSMEVKAKSGRPVPITSSFKWSIWCLGPHCQQSSGFCGFKNKKRDHYQTWGGKSMRLGELLIYVRAPIFQWLNLSRTLVLSESLNPDSQTRRLTAKIIDVTVGWQMDCSGVSFAMFIFHRFFRSPGCCPAAQRPASSTRLRWSRSNNKRRKLATSRCVSCGLREFVWVLEGTCLSWGSQLWGSQCWVVALGYVHSRTCCIYNS